MNSKQILIVDDDARNIFALKATLSARKFNCISCSSAAEAIHVLKSGSVIDIVLLDMMMPELDGYEAIPAIREIPGREQLPIISVTAQAMVGDRQKCLDAGANEYLSKPINVDMLLHLLNTL
jgi:CheY-like chemotaxis protein